MVMRDRMHGPRDPRDPRLTQLMSEWDIAMHYARVITLLPIDKWLADLEHAESVAPILDPTAYRDYIYSPNPEIIKKVFRALLEVKRVVEGLQPQLKEMLEKGENR